MKEYTVSPNQTWTDVCLTVYGSLELIGVLIEDNNVNLDVQPEAGDIVRYRPELQVQSVVQNLSKRKAIPATRNPQNL